MQKHIHSAVVILVSEPIVWRVWGRKRAPSSTVRMAEDVIMQKLVWLINLYGNIAPCLGLLSIPIIADCSNSEESQTHYLLPCMELELFFNVVEHIAELLFTVGMRCCHYINLFIYLFILLST